MALDRDAYFTPSDTCEVLVKEIIEKIPNALDYTWVEPSAGSGNFLEAAKNAGVKNYEAYDIHPFHPEVEKISDFLTEDLDLTGKLVFGNPPYGFRNKLSIAFVNRAFSLGAEYVAFYLLSSISYLTYRKQMPFAKMIGFNRIGSIFVDEHNQEIKGYSSNFALIIFKKSESAISYKPKKRFKASRPDKATLLMQTKGFIYNVDRNKLEKYDRHDRDYDFFALLNGAVVHCLEADEESVDLLKKHEKEIIEIGNRSVTNRPSATEINWFLHCKYDQSDPTLL